MHSLLSGFKKGLLLGVFSGFCVSYSFADDESLGAKLYDLGIAKELSDEKDDAQALKYFLEASDADYPPANLKVGLFYLEGKGTYRDEEKGAFYIQLAAEQGSAEALLAYGDLLKEGRGVKKDLSKAADYYTRASSLGVDEANLRLARLYREDDRKLSRDDDKAAPFYIKAAKQGNLEALEWLGEYYSNDSETLSQAVEYYEQAAEKGSQKALKWLGKYFLDRGEAGQQQELALNYLKKASEKGDAEAKLKLAKLYLEGKEVELDLQFARELFSESASMGSAEASFYLGEIFTNGIGVLPDLEKGAEHYFEASKGEYTPAYVRIGRSYYLGEGLDQSDDEALRYFQVASSQGDPEADYWMGRAFYEGRGVKLDKAQAAKYLNQAVTHGNQDAMWILGRMYLHGDGISQDVARGVDLISTLAEVGEPNAQFFLAKIMYEGTYVKVDTEKAFQWLKLSAESDLVEAKTLLGIFYLQGIGTKTDLTQGIENLKWAAEKEDPTAQLHYGKALVLGLGGKVDYQQAAYFIEEAAKKGLADAQNSMGDLYFDGVGVDQDYDEAKHWFALAAKQDHAEAIVSLGRMYLDGIGGYQSHSQAMEMFKRGAELNHPKAQFFLGSLYLEGKGTVKSPTQAAFFLKLAADQKHTASMLLLGRMYEEGIGQAKVLKQAAFLYHNALTLGDDKAANELARLYLEKGEGLSSELVLALQRLASDHDPEANYYLGAIALKEDATSIEAKEYLEKAASQGVRRASLLLAQHESDPLRRESHLLAAKTESTSIADLELAKLYAEESSFQKEEEAADLLKRYLKEFSDPSASALLGHMYYQGNGVERNVAKAIRYLESASKSNYSEAHRLLGVIYSDATHKQYSFEKARSYFNQAIESGIEQAHLDLGKAYLDLGDKERAFAQLGKAQSAGFEEGAFLRALVLLDKNYIGYNEDLGLSELKELATQAYTPAMKYYADHMWNNNHVDEAAKIYTELSHLGDEEVAYPLGIYYYSKGDTNQALPYLEKAHAKGYVDASYYLGISYLDAHRMGEGIALIEEASSKGYTEAHKYLYNHYSNNGHEEAAFKHLRFAADQGDLTSQLDIAGLYALDHDLEKSLHYYLRAAENHSSEAYMKLGEIYKEGRGVLPNLHLAVENYASAASMGSVEAKFQLGSLYLQETLILDEKTGLELLEDAAGNHHPQALLLLGNYFMGRDQEKALHYLSAALEKDQYQAANSMYVLLKDSDEHREVVLNALRKASDANDSSASRTLAEWHLNRGEEEQAVTYYQRAYENGDLQGAIYLGQTYLEEGKLNEALIFLKEAYKEDRAEAAYLLGKTYVMLSEVEAGLGYLKEAAENAHTGAVKYLIDYYGTLGDHESENSYEERLASLGDLETQLLVADDYYNQESYEKALRYYKLADKNGSLFASRALGEMYLKGKGVKKDLLVAKDHLEKALGLEENKPYYLLGILYEELDGEVERSMKYLHQADEEGDIRASMHIARLFLGNKELLNAVPYYEKASQKGSIEAKHALGNLYLDATLPIYDEEKATGELKVAAEANYLPSIKLLADFYWQKKEYDQGVIYYRKSYELGELNDGYYVGTYLFNNRKTHEDVLESIEILKKSYSSGNPKVSLSLGKALIEGKQTLKGLELIIQSASYGEPEAYRYLSKYYLDEGDYRESLIYLEKLAISGDLEAKISVAKKYYSGRGTSKDFEKAAKYFKEAADMGSVLAQFYMGMLYYEGVGVPRVVNKSIHYFDLAANNGDAEAAHNLGNIYFDGKDIEPNLEKALLYFQKALSNGGGKKTKEALASVYHLMGDNENALPLWKEAAMNGNSESAYLLGKYFYDNEDSEQGEHYLKRAADNSHIKAMITLSDILLQSDSSSQDAITYLEGAYRLGAETTVKKIYQFHLQQKDYEKAYPFLVNAADNEDYFALEALGDIYDEGLTGEADPEKAFYYYRKASAGGVASAHMKLAQHYLKGKGASVNTSKALKHLEVAARGGVVDAQNTLFKLALHEGEELGDKTLVSLFDTALKNENHEAPYYYGIYWLDKNAPEKALPYLEQAKDNGDYEATKQLAKIYHEQEDYDQELQMLNILSKQGDIEALELLGQWYLDGKFVTQDLDQSLGYYLSVYEKGKKEVASTIGKIYSMQNNRDASIEYYSDAANQGSLDVGVLLGDLYFEERDYPQAFKFYQLAANQGSAHAYYQLGKMYLRGQGVSVSEGQGLHYLKLALDAGELKAAYKLGQHFKDQDITKALFYFEYAAKKEMVHAQNFLVGYYFSQKEYSKALAHLESLAQKRKKSALFDLGKLYQKGYGVEKNLDKALSYFRRAAEEGEDKAYLLLGDTYWERGEKEDALKAYRVGSEKGVLEALMFLGKYHFERKEYDTALTYLELAIEKGDEESHFLLGKIYAQGLVGEKDLEKALFYFSFSEQAENEEVLVWIGRIYLEMGKEDIALEYYTKAAQIGNLNAQVYLSNYYTENKMFKAALYFYERSAKNGNLEAQYQAGRILVEEDSVPLDEEKAFQYLTLADSRGHGRAAYLLGSLYIQKSQEEMSFYYFKRAADREVTEAESYLGKYYLQRGNHAKAFKYFEKAQAKGDIDSIYHLASMYYLGNGVEQDLDLSLQYLLRVKESKISYVQELTAKVYEALGDMELSLQYYKAAANNNFESSIAYLASYYEESNQLSESLKFYNLLPESDHKHLKSGELLLRLDREADAVSYLQKAHAEGNEEASLALSKLFINKGESSQGEKFLLEAAENGSDKARKSLAIYYYDTEQLDLAAQQFEKLIENDIESKYYLGEIYVGYDDSLLKDKGVDLLKDCHDKGFIKASVLLGNYYVNKGEAELSLPYYIVSAGQKNLKSIKFLASYFSKKGEFSKSKKYLEDAMQLGSQAARFDLAILYKEGLGTKKDLNKAEELLTTLDSKRFVNLYNIFGDISHERGDLNSFEAYYKKAASQGNHEAIYKLAKHYHEQENYSDATSYWEKIEGDNQYPEASYYLGNYNLKGLAGDIDERKAISQLESALEAGIGLAGKELGSFYRIEGWLDEAIIYYEKAYALGVNIDFALGDLYYDAGLFSLAYEHYAKEAQEGDKTAQRLLAKMIWLGEGTKKDLERAADYYKLSADQGDQVSQETIADLYYRGVGVPKDDKLSFSYYQAAADNGSNHALLKLGVFYRDGIGTEIDTEKAVALFKQGVDFGNPLSAYELGSFYFNNGNKEEALELLEKASSENILKATLLLGEIYFAAQDYDLGIRYYTQAASQGSEQALYFLGNLYFKGDYVEKDLAKAADLLNDAKDLGNLPSTYLLGELKKSSNVKEALELYLQASLEGHVKSSLRLGDYYYNKEQFTEAIPYYVKASEGRSVRALTQLGRIYYKGLGVEVNHELAASYLIPAVEQNSYSAAYLLGKIFDEKKEETSSIYFFNLAAKGGHKGAQVQLANLFLQRKRYRQALNYLHLLAASEDKEAHLHLGRMYLYGLGVEKNLRRAIKHLMVTDEKSSYANYYLGEAFFKLKEEDHFVRYFDTAAHDGVLKAQRGLGEYYLSRNNNEKALYYFTMAANQSDAVSNYQMGLLYIEGKGVNKDLNLAQSYFQQSAKLGEPRSLYQLGRVYELQKDTSQAIYFYEKAVSHKFEGAYKPLALLYQDMGEHEKAFGFFKMVADKGDEESEFLVASAYYTGKGVEQDLELAADYYKLAADRGMGKSQEMMGEFYRLGVGVPLNPELSFHYYSLAADQGNLEAKFNLGMAYLEGKGVEKNLALAEALLQPLGVNGDSRAWKPLSSIYQVNKEHANALKFMELAADKGDEEALAYVINHSRVTGNLSSEVKYLKVGADFDVPVYNYEYALALREGKAQEEEPGGVLSRLYKSAEKGYSKAFVVLGDYFAEKGDYEKSVDNYLIAVEKGEGDAYFPLAKIFSSQNLDQRALKFYNLAANQDHPEALYEAALCYLKGKGTEIDLEKGANMMRRSADHGFTQAELALGKLYESGTGVPKDISQSIYYLEQAQAKGEADASFHLGALLAKEGDQKNLPKAIQTLEKINEDERSWHLLGSLYEEMGNRESSISYLEKAANNGHKGALRSMGNLYWKSKEYDKGVQFYLPLAEKNDPEASYIIGKHYLGAWGADVDIEKAIHYLDISAQTGRLSAHRLLGKIFYQGKGLPRDLERSFEHLSQSKMGADNESLYMLGQLYGDQELSQHDTVKSERYLKHAANRGHALAQEALGLFYLNGKGEDKSEMQALFYLKLAADQGLASSQLTLGKLYLNDRVYKKQGMQYLEKAATQSYAPAESYLGRLYLSKSGGEKLSRALALLTSASEEDIPEALSGLGMMYVQGNGVQKDEAKGFQYLIRAANQGYGEAEYEVGNLYAFGSGTERDDEKAAHYFEMAAKHSYGQAYYRLGEIYDSGMGRAQSEEEAKRYFELAANEGVIDAHLWLGKYYRSSELGKRDVSKSLEHYQKAAQANHPLGYFYLGEFYRKGLEVEKDLYTAIKMYRKSDAMGYKDSKRMIHEIAQLAYNEGFSKLTRNNELTPDAIEYLKAASFGGHIEANKLLGESYLVGKGASKDEKKALSYYRLAADRGDLSSQMKVGHFFKQGVGCTQSLELAEKYFKEASNQGDPEAQYEVALILEDLDNPRAIEFLQLSASKRYSPSFKLLGDIYQEGRITEKNLSKSINYYQLAADASYGPALDALGHVFLYGEGAGEDWSLALDYFEQAAELGVLAATTRLGEIYSSDDFDRKDMDKAITYLTQAAGQGSQRSKALLAKIYYEADGVTQDLDLAYQFAKEAADDDNDLGQYLLGRMFLDGLHLPFDSSKALEYLELSADQGNSFAQYYLAEYLRLQSKEGEISEKVINLYTLSAMSKHLPAISKLAEIYQDSQQGIYDESLSLQYFREGAEQEDLSSQLYLTKYYQNLGDEKQTLHYLELAAKNGHASSMMELGRSFMQGSVLPKNTLLGISWLKRASHAGNADASYEVAQFLYENWETIIEAEDAFSYFKTAYEQGYKQAAAQIAKMQYIGEGVDRDVKAALPYLHIASDMNDPFAQNVLGQLYFQGEMIRKDQDRGLSLIQKAAEQGEIESQAFLAEQLLSVSPDKNKVDLAVNYYAKASKGGYAPAQLALGEMYYYGKYVQKDLMKAFSYLSLAADQGVPAAETLMGHIHYYGQGVPINTSIAERYYTLAADNLEADALFHLGKMYSKGESKHPHQDTESLRFIIRAAQEGHRDAKFVLGKAYMTGVGMGLDTVKAAQYFTEIANQGHVQAMAHLASLYYRGDGVPKDYTRAFELYSEAAHSGISFAMRQLGVQYLRGHGVQKDAKEAFKWFSKGAEAEDHISVIWLAKLHERGVGTERDEQKAYQYYYQAMSFGVAEAQAWIGKYYRENNELDLAIQYLKLASDQGHLMASLELGKIYLDTASDDEGLDLARTYLARATESENREALYYLGSIFVKNENTREQGLSLIHKSADKGLLEAKLALAKIFEAGAYGVNKNLPESLNYYYQAARAGDASAYLWLANYYQLGNSPQYRKHASFFLSQALAMNAKEAYVLSAKNYLFGREKNPEKAFELLTQGEKLGATSASKYLAYCYQEGLGTSVDTSQAEHYYQKALNQGQRGVSVALAKLMNTSGKKQEAIDLLSKAKPSGRSQNELGVLYLTRNYEGDEFAAFNAFEKGSTLGSKEAKLNLAIAYYLGRGCRKDVEKAYGILTDLAKQGDMRAYLQLAHMHADTSSPYFDYHRSFYYYSHVWEANGSLSTIEPLGLMYFTGSGVAKDNEKAWHYLGQLKGKLSAFTHFAKAKLILERKSTNYKEQATAHLMEAAHANLTSAYKELAHLFISDQSVSDDKLNFVVKAADAGDLVSQEFLGKKYLESDATKSAQYFQMADANGSTSASYYIGKDLLAKGSFPKEAYTYLKKSAESGDKRAYPLLASAILQNYSTLQDLEEAAKYVNLSPEGSSQKQELIEHSKRFGYQMEASDASPQGKLEASLAYEIAYDFGDAEASLWLADYYVSSGEKDGPRYQKGINIYESLAQNGNAQAKKNLLSLLVYDVETGKRYGQTYTYLKEAAELGDINAKWEFAKYTILEEDQSSKELAISYLEDNAKAGNVKSMALLGRLYLEGVFVERNIKTAISYFKSAANLGDARSQDIVGAYLVQGIGVAANLHEGVSYLEKAAKQGQVSSMELLGEVYLGNYGSDANPQQAKYYLQSAYSEGSRVAALQLGKESIPGGVLSQDLLLAKSLLQESYDKGWKDAAIPLSKLYYHGWGTEKDFQKAYSLLISVENDLEGEGLYLLGRMYTHGEGTSQNIDLGKNYYLKASDRGHIQATFELGKQLYNTDKDRAISYLRQAAKSNHPEANWMLADHLSQEGTGNTQEGAMALFKSAQGGWVGAQLLIIQSYLDGKLSKEIPINQEMLSSYLENTISAYPSEGAYLKGRYYAEKLRDDQKAFEYFLEAAQRGNGQAQYFVGIMLRDARVSPRDSMRAVDYWREASAQNIPEAQFELAKAYDEGSGAEEDKALAREFYEKLPLGQFPGVSYRLGEMYYQGIGGRVDYYKSYENFSRAYQEGETLASRWIGIQSYFGQGTPKDDKAAFNAFREGADAGDPISQNWLGVCYYEGIGALKDLSKAKDNFEKAAFNGVTRAKFWLGILAYHGDGLFQSLSEARNYFQEASHDGDVEAIYWLGMMQYRGEGGREDFHAARQNFSRAAELGHKESLSWLGHMQKEGLGGDANAVSAYETFKKAAAKGDSSAMYWAGMLALDESVGSPQDALKHFEEAVSHDYVRANTQLALLYHKGWGVDQDGSRALDLLKEASNLGDSEGQYVLGNMFRLGKSVRQDDAMSIHYYSLAADQGEVEAQAWLGNYYYLGGFYYTIDESQKDYQKAAKYLQLAADQGHARAQNYLGELYYYGKGVRKNLRRAAKYFDLAAKQGNSDAKNNLRKLSIR